MVETMRASTVSYELRYLILLDMKKNHLEPSDDLGNFSRTMQIEESDSKNTNSIKLGKKEENI